MKIAFITTMQGPPWAGSEELWFKAAQYLLNNGHSVMAVVFESAASSNKVKMLKEAGALISIRKSTINNKKSLLQKAVFKIEKTIKGKFVQLAFGEVLNFKPDVICLSQGYTFHFVEDGVYGALFDAINRPFLLLSQYNPEFTGIMPPARISKAKKYINKASGFLFVAARNLKTAERQIASSIKNGIVIDNPVNLNSIGVLNYPGNNGILKMACVARYDCYCKGQDILFQALGSENWQNRKFALELYGSGPDEEYLQSLIDYYSLRDKVFIKGQVSNINKIWEDNEVLVLPSLSEGTPLALVEAMLCGRTALSTDVGGIARYIINNSTGFLAPVSSVNALSAALEDLWENRARLQEMGKAAFEHAMTITDLTPGETLANYLVKA
ncbi:glycosyltransferase involved in cell wall biosynthesis [Mucilaginibacter gracilis]|uniref:Glycosyltransferase involved in cell wall biosynthesis n=1 Tax=Mucilaginibacter gracilis TaxID=423350 RepID=A0A495J1N7_9SPHI|nr:glycosyltransferase [Mucilaginibacter gracilis]RKR82248.1 glycosyltransferase involved in cell wall biosynthesis [Mucilaginibacter gracilis]